MKKLLLCFGILSILLTGCTKNYNSMEKYVADMKATRAKYDAFFFEANKATVEGNVYSRNMLVCDKYRTDLSDDDGYTYTSSVMYDGKDLYNYVEGQDTVQVTSGVDYKTAISMNPYAPVFNWWEDIENGKAKAKFINNSYFRSAFDCRLIEFNDGREICVADKYGIAVYYKQEPLSQGYLRTGTIIDVLNIDVKTDAPRGIFTFPDNIKRVPKK